MNEVSTKSHRIEEIQAQWLKERPDLQAHIDDTALVGRLLGTAFKINKLGLNTLRPVGLGQTDFDVMACLRRRGVPYTATPGDILQDMMITSGTLTTCADRLLKKGLITRVRSERDERSRLLSLTAKGLQMVNELTSKRFTLASDIAKALSTDEREALHQLLAKLSDALDA